MATPSLPKLGAGSTFGGGNAGPSPWLPRRAPRASKLSDWLMHADAPGKTGMTDPVTGLQLTEDEIAARGPIRMNPMAASSMGHGRGGYGAGGYGGSRGFRPPTGRPSARNSAEYYAQRDAAVGNPLTWLEQNNGPKMESFLAPRTGDVWEQTKSSAMRGSGFGPPAVVLSPSTTDAIVQQGASGGIPKNVADGLMAAVTSGEMTVEQARAAASESWRNQQSSAANQQSQLMSDAQASEIQRRRDDAIKRANFMGGSAGVSFGPPPAGGATFGGVPRDITFQSMANNQGQPSRYAAPRPAGPFGPSDQFAKYANAGQLNQFRPPQFGASLAPPLNIPQQFGQAPPQVVPLIQTNRPPSAPMSAESFAPPVNWGSGRPSALPAPLTLTAQEISKMEEDSMRAYLNKVNPENETITFSPKKAISPDRGKMAGVGDRLESIIEWLRKDLAKGG